MGGVLTKSLPYKLKRTILICNAQNKALCSIEAFAPSAKDYEQLDLAVAGLGRMAMAGKAATRNEEGEVVRSLSTAEILHHWGIAPAALEVKLRRLCWYQSMARDVEGNTHVLCAIFGVTRMELQEGASEDDGVKIDGSIGCNPTPWCTQFFGDMGALALMDGAGELCELVGDRHAMVFQGGPAKDLPVAVVVSARKGSQRDTGAGGRRGEHGHPSHSSVPHATQAKKTDVTAGIAICEVDLRDRRTSIKVHFDCCSSSCR